MGLAPLPSPMGFILESNGVPEIYHLEEASVKHGRAKSLRQVSIGSTKVFSFSLLHYTEFGSVLPEGLDQLPPKNILFTFILTTVSRAEVCIRA